MTPTHAPCLAHSTTWDGSGSIHISGPITIEGDRVLVDRNTIRKLLIDAHDQLTSLGQDLLLKWRALTGNSCNWNLDAYLVSLMGTLCEIAQSTGIDYNGDVVEEAHRRCKDGDGES